MALKLGMFLTPATLPARATSEIIDWNLDVIRKAEEVGYAEVWVGSHITSRWSPIAVPQQLIARALADTRRIMLGSGVEALYQHHPVTLAAALAQLDHMARGRLLFGFGAGATLSDLNMFGVDGATSHEMAREALGIILSCWEKDGPQDFDGKYWKIRRPHDPYSPDNYGWHYWPYAPHEPRIAFAGGFSRKSSMLRLAGERGFIPMSLNFNPQHLGGHWDSVTEGAAANGRVPDRRKWRQVRDIYVADTEREARKAALDGCMAKFWSHYFKPICEKLNSTDLFRPLGADQSVEVTADYLVDQGVWFVGDPASVAQQIREQFKVTGGFGTLLQLGSDYSDPWAREGWFRSMELLATEVMPRLGDLVVPESQAQPG